MHFLLFYEKTADHKLREPPLAQLHRQHLDAAVRRGELLLAGSFEDPVDGAAMLLFDAETPAIAEAFAKADPYVVDGLVNRWRVRKWDTVVGTELKSTR
ncbi:YciI-like protein [soil metagenome]